jgi:hypothetical protein
MIHLKKIKKLFINFHTFFIIFHINQLILLVSYEIDLILFLAISSPRFLSQDFFRYFYLPPKIF